MSLSPSSYRFNFPARSSHFSSLSDLSASGSSHSGASFLSQPSSSDMGSRGSLSIATSSFQVSSVFEGSEHGTSSEPSSPLRPASIQSTNTFGSTSTPGAASTSTGDEYRACLSSAASTSTGDEYRACLSADALQRADGKRNELARQKENDVRKGKDEDGDLFRRVRTGRGGAGIIVRAGGQSINAGEPLSIACLCS